MDNLTAAKLLAIPSALFLGSYNFTFSQNVMPHLYKESSAVMTPFFDKVYHRGAATILPVAIVAISANVYLASQSHGSERQLYGTAAGLVFATLPLTQLFMKGGIDRLIAISTDASLHARSDVQMEVVRLLKTWAAQNYFRSSLHLTGGVLSLYAALR